MTKYKTKVDQGLARYREDYDQQRMDVSKRISDLLDEILRIQRCYTSYTAHCVTIISKMQDDLDYLEYAVADTKDQFNQLREPRECYNASRELTKLKLISHRLTWLEVELNMVKTIKYKDWFDAHYR